jgi:hypothetical protein
MAVFAKRSHFETAASATLGQHVGIIVGARAQEEMVGIEAARIIAAM